MPFTVTLFPEGSVEHNVFNPYGSSLNIIEKNPGKFACSFQYSDNIVYIGTPDEVVRVKNRYRLAGRECREQGINLPTMDAVSIQEGEQGIAAGIKKIEILLSKYFQPEQDARTGR